MSIILPVYNGADYLEQCIQSVQSQTDNRYELIIVDDGSTDDTTSILNKISAPKIKVITHPENRGLPTALNTGHKYASGNVMSWISADNILAPRFVEAFLSVTEKCGDDFFVISSYHTIDAEGRTTGYVKYTDDLLYRSMLLAKPGVASFAYSRHSFQRVGLYEAALFGVEDWDYFLRLSEVTPPVFLPEPLYFYRQHGASLTSLKQKMIRKATDYMATTYLNRHNGVLPFDLLFPELSWDDFALASSAAMKAIAFTGTAFLRKPQLSGFVPGFIQFLDLLDSSVSGEIYQQQRNFWLNLIAAFRAHESGDTGQCQEILQRLTPDDFDVFGKEYAKHLVEYRETRAFATEGSLRVPAMHALHNEHKFNATNGGLKTISSLTGQFDWHFCEVSDVESVKKPSGICALRQPKKGLRLVVIPSDPLWQYARKGIGHRKQGYYNPDGFFGDVICLSPYETAPFSVFGMEVVQCNHDNLARLLDFFQPDLVRAYGGMLPCELAAQASGLGYKTTVSIHDTNTDILSESIHDVSNVIAVSEAVRRTLRQQGVDDNKITVIPNGIIQPRLSDKSGLRRLSHFMGSKFTLLHVGRRAEQKNLDTVIKALEILGPDYTCLSVGVGPVHPYVNLARDLDVLDRIWFIDSVPGNLLPHYYRAADALVVPSRWEGFGMIFPEAMAAGGLVVTSNIAPMNEFLRHEENGYLIDAYQDPDAVASLIASAMGRRMETEKIRLAAIRDAQQFDQRKVDQQILAYYANILEPGQLSQ